MGEMESMWAYICYLQVSQFGVVIEDSGWKIFYFVAMQVPTKMLYRGSHILFLVRKKPVSLTK